MLSGGLGQQVLDAYGNPVPMGGGGGVLTAAGQSSVMQTPIGQWGVGEWAVAGLVAYIAYSVFFTTRRGASTIARRFPFE